MPDTAEIKIHTTAPPRRRLSWPWAVLGIPVVLMGVFLIVVIVGKAREAPPGSPVRTNAFLPIGFAAFFVVVGSSCVVGGTVSTLRELRRRRDAAARAGEPWLMDHGWDPAGERGRAREDPVGRFVGIVCLCLLVAPFDYWVVAAEPGPIAKAVVLAANLLVVWAILVIVVRTLRKLRQGRVSIRYGRFPFFLGESLDVRVTTGKPLPPGLSMTARLRYVWEKTELGRRASTDYFQLYLDEATVTADGRGELSIGFPLPEGEKVTVLFAPYRRFFWELQLEGNVEGVAFDERFAVPVYRRPTPASAVTAPAALFS